MVKQDRWFTHPMFYFSVLLLLKIVLVRYVIFHQIDLLHVLAVDLPSLFVAFALIELLVKKRKFTAYMAVNIVFTSIFFAAIMYFKYFGVIVTFRALQQSNQVLEVKPSVMNLLHPQFLLIYADLVLFIALRIFRKGSRLWHRGPSRMNKVLASSLLIVALSASCVNTVTNDSIINEIKQAHEMGILNYEVAAIVAYFREEQIDPNEVSVKSIQSLKGIVRPDAPLFREAAKGKNVIVIQMEAMQNFLLHLQIEGREITPVLNGLIGESLYLPHVFQMVGQGNTVDAEFMLNTSFHIPRDGAASQSYGDKQLPSFPKMLKEAGYRAVTFHTNDIAFWSRNELYPAIGFDQYYDDDFFGHDDIVDFGASDEVLYRKTAEELERYHREGQKFYANVISMSGHHPFNIPERKRRMQLPSEFDDTLVGDYIVSQNYADYALGQFIDQLKQSGLWEDSVVMIYGDHMGLPIYSLDDHQMNLMHDLIGKDYNYDTMMNIPLLLHVPGEEARIMPDRIGGQVDFMPTLANLLGVSLQNHIHFGQDLLNHQNNVLGERYYLPTGSFIDNRMIFIPGKGVDDGTVIPLDGKPAESDKSVRDKFNHALKLLEMSDSYVKNLPAREK